MPLPPGRPLGLPLMPLVNMVMISCWWRHCMCRYLMQKINTLLSFCRSETPYWGEVYLSSVTSTGLGLRARLGLGLGLGLREHGFIRNPNRNPNRFFVSSYPSVHSRRSRAAGCFPAFQIFSASHPSQSCKSCSSFILLCPHTPATESSIFLTGFQDLQD